ncbi:DUF3310 domain-containing protein, partial [Staphylococcus aureus]
MSVISNRKVDMNEAQDNVKQPAHYTYGDIEIIDFIEQVTACLLYTSDAADDSLRVDLG